MSRKTEELEKRVEALEHSIFMLKELSKIHSERLDNCFDFMKEVHRVYNPIDPNGYDDRILPDIKPPYKFTCKGGK